MKKMDFPKSHWRWYGTYGSASGSVIQRYRYGSGSASGSVPKCHGSGTLWKSSYIFLLRKEVLRISTARISFQLDFSHDLCPNLLDNLDFIRAIRVLFLDVKILTLVVLRIRDVYPGSCFLSIPDPATATKEKGENFLSFFVATADKYHKI